jgi:hypothetical protein
MAKESQTRLLGATLWTREPCRHRSPRARPAASTIRRRKSKSGKFGNPPRRKNENMPAKCSGKALAGQAHRRLSIVEHSPGWDFSPVPAPAKRRKYNRPPLEIGPMAFKTKKAATEFFRGLRLRAIPGRPLAETELLRALFARHPDHEALGEPGIRNFTVGFNDWP